MRLLERDAHLDALHAALERARRGSGSVMLVSGEAGIGKSSLLTEFADRAAGQARLFRGSCEDLVTARTLGPCGSPVFRNCFISFSPIRLSVTSRLNFTSNQLTSRRVSAR